MSVTNRPTGQKNSQKKIECLQDNMQQKTKGDGGSAAQKRRAAPLADTTRTRKNSSTPVASDTTDEKGEADKNKAITNRNLAQGKASDVVRTATSYFNAVWNAFSKHTDGSMSWIPNQIVAIGEYFHSPKASW